MRNSLMIHADLQNLLSNASALPRTTTLFRESGLRTLLLHLKPGERIPEHRTPGAILVQCLAGEGVFSVADDWKDLRPGTLISVPPSISHTVAAAGHDDLLLLMTVSEHAAAG